jgi:hypothetical protein
MTTTNDYIGQAMAALLDGENDRALGLMLRASMSYDSDIDAQIVADAEAARTKPIIKSSFANDDPAAPWNQKPDLPQMIPLNPKRIGPSHFKCPLCSAKPGKPCVKISNRGTTRAEGDDSIGSPLAGNTYHTARQELSKEAKK